MSTLIYNPGVRIIISTRAGGVLDVSDDIEAGSLTLNENRPHLLNFTLSNANSKYSQLFTPNDRVIVLLKRLNWMQVMSGYLDTVPYYSAYPRSVNITATCTLKRLEYFGWDAASANVVGLLIGLTTISNNTAPTDTIPGVIIQVLTQVVGWAASKIHFGALPQGWMDKIAPLWSAVEADQAAALAILAPQGGAGGTTSGGGGLSAAGGSNPGQPWTAGAWASYILGLIGAPQTANNITNFQCWMGVENDPSTWWENITSGAINPLNNGLGSGGGGGTGTYPDLLTAAQFAAQEILGINGSGLNNTILNALKADVSLANFTLACQASNWSTGKYPGGLKDPSRLTSNPAPTNLGVQPPLISGGSGTAPPTTSGGGGGSGTAPPTTTNTVSSPVSSGIAQGRVDQGIDYSGVGTVNAVGAGTIVLVQTSGWGSLGNAGLGACIILKLDSPPDALHSMVYYAESIIPSVSVGQHVASGAVLGAENSGSIEVGWADPNALGNPLAPLDPANTGAATSEGTNFLNYIKGAPMSTSGSQTGSGSAGGGAAGLLGALQYGLGQWDPSAAAIDITAPEYIGLKVLEQDQAILPMITSLMQVAMRSYCSAPNGDLIAWWPDYFGQYGTLAKWHLSMIELIDFQMDWSDAKLLTHIYVAGQIQTLNQTLDPTGNTIPLSTLDQIMSYGTATIDIPQILYTLFDIDPAGNSVYATPASIYRQFGARVHFEYMPTVAYGLAEFWFALQLFITNWSKQFSATIELTFMPELFPGMLLALDDIGVQVYINSVTHNWSLSEGAGGFNTTVNVQSPSAIAKDGTGMGTGLVGLAKGG